VFSKSAKSFDLALEIKKIRTKCKSSGCGPGLKRNVSLPALLAIAGALATIPLQEILVEFLS
jgi:hypothetical protein